MIGNILKEMEKYEKFVLLEQKEEWRTLNLDWIVGEWHISIMKCWSRLYHFITKYKDQVQNWKPTKKVTTTEDILWDYNVWGQACWGE